MNRCAEVVVRGFRVRVESVCRRGQPTGHPPAGGGAGPTAHSLLAPIAVGPRTLRGFVDTELAPLVRFGAAAPLIAAAMGAGDRFANRGRGAQPARTTSERIEEFGSCAHVASAHRSNSPRSGRTLTPNR